MSKYNLVAINYNNKGLKEERIIKLKGIYLDNLIGIDKFTSGIDICGLWKTIKNENELGDKFRLKIKYARSNTKVYYYDIIADNKIINSCLQDVFFSKERYTNVIDKNNLYFIQEYRWLMELIYTYGVNKCEKLYFSNNIKLLNLLKKYFSGFYDETEKVSKDKMLFLIEEEFSRYVVFRNWIVNLEKLRNNMKVKKYDENYIDDYFDKKYGVKYNEYLACKYNLRYIDDDKEEFIEASELEMMGIIDGSGIKKIRRKK